MDRPETIELVGQALRWRVVARVGRVPFYTHYKSDDGRAFVALSIYGDVDWEIEVIKGSVTLRGHADDLGEASEDARAALAEVADAVAAWLPEREASVRAEERERCAAVVDRVRDGLDAGDDPYGDGLADASRLIAKEIRALTPAVRT